MKSRSGSRNASLSVTVTLETLPSDQGQEAGVQPGLIAQIHGLAMDWPWMRPWLRPWHPVAIPCCHGSARKNPRSINSSAHCSSCLQSPTQPLLSCLSSSASLPSLKDKTPLRAETRELSLHGRALRAERIGSAFDCSQQRAAPTNSERTMHDRMSLDSSFGAFTAVPYRADSSSMRRLRLWMSAAIRRCPECIWD
jgi:hypothetical protein